MRRRNKQYFGGVRVYTKWEQRLWTLLFFVGIAFALFAVATADKWFHLDSRYHSSVSCPFPQYNDCG